MEKIMEGITDHFLGYFFIGLFVGMLTGFFIFGKSNVVIKEPFSNQDTLYVDDRGICYRYEKVYDFNQNKTQINNDKE